MRPMQCSTDACSNHPYSAPAASIPRRARLSRHCSQARDTLRRGSRSVNHVRAARQNQTRHTHHTHRDTNTQMHMRIATPSARRHAYVLPSANSCACAHLAFHGQGCFSASLFGHVVALVCVSWCASLTCACLSHVPFQSIACSCSHLARTSAQSPSPSFIPSCRHVGNSAAVRSVRTALIGHMV